MVSSVQAHLRINSLCSWRSSLGPGLCSVPPCKVGAALGTASWAPQYKAPRDGAQGKRHRRDEPYPGTWRCLLRGTPTPVAVGGDELKSRSRSLSTPTILHNRRGGLIAAGASNASQVYLLHQVRAATAVVLYLHRKAFLCPVLPCLFIPCHIPKLHESLARWRKWLVSFRLQWCYALQGLWKMGTILSRQFLPNCGKSEKHVVC